MQIPAAASPRAGGISGRARTILLEDLERLEQLLQWMLRLARAEQWAHGALRRDLQVIDVTATCEEAVERIRHLAESRKATVHLSKNGPVLFRADPEDLQLVWTNLLENAVRYGPEGGSGGRNGQVREYTGPARIIFDDHMAGVFLLPICPTSSSAFIAEIFPAPGLREALALGLAIAVKAS